MLVRNSVFFFYPNSVLLSLKVTISNLRKINGEYATISFDTVFFNLNDF